MKKYHLIPLLFTVPLQLHSATVVLPSIEVAASSPNPSVAPTANVSILGIADIAVDIANAGTTTSGAFGASAIGGTSITLLGDTVGAELVTHTSIASSGITFGTRTTYTGDVGQILANSAILSNIVGADLAPEWEATIDLTALGLNLSPSTTYALSFNLIQSTSLLGNLSPALFDTFTVAVGDSSGVLPAQFLGLTDFTASSGTATFTFTTGATVEDMTLTFGASALLDTDLLGDVLGAPNQTLYSMSNINFDVVPEPGVFTMLGVVGVAFAIRRRRGSAC